jgi:hypothetical protein
MIQATPKLTGSLGIFQSTFLALAFALVGFIPIGLLINYFYLDKPYAKPPAVLMVAAFCPGLLFGIWYVKNLRNRHCWILTETDLIGGLGKKTFPLTSITKIIVGLPNETFIPAAGKILENDEPGSTTSTVLSISSVLVPRLGMIRRNFQIRESQRERTFLLIFNDGSLLPLYLLLSKNGEALMAELESKLRNRLIFDYDFSQEQAHKLSMFEANVLIPAEKSPRFTFNS